MLQIPCELPGLATYRALLDLLEFHAQEYPKDRMLVLTENRVEADIEHKAWAPEDVDASAAEAERTTGMPLPELTTSNWIWRKETERGVTAEARGKRSRTSKGHRQPAGVRSAST